MNCFCCGSPFHVASGQLFGPQDTPFCGPCSRDLFRFCHDRGAMRTRGLRFSDYATPLPVADVKAFKFFSTEVVPGAQRGFGTHPHVVTQGVTVEEAHEKAREARPGAEFWCWYELTTDSNPDKVEP